MPDLHNRLNHIVTYSSQLVFVSGDTIAEQQHFLDDFVYKQIDTEVSFFAAQDGHSASEYRRIICRQLAAHQVGSYVRPMSDLLHDLDTTIGPYLVCITHAEKLSNEFLQELWDWIAAVQQNPNKIHLNIILFGQSDWAKASQKWLPSENKNKPLLLSSQKVTSSSKYDLDALEELMSKKNIDQNSALTKPWFIASVLSIFLIVFVAVFTWQYPTIFKKLKKDSEPQEPQAIEAFNIDQSQFKNAIVEESLVLNTTETTPKSALVRVEPKEIENKLTDQILVKSWDEQTNNNVNSVSEPITQELEPEQLVTDQDYQVPDIVSIEDLNSNLMNNNNTMEQVSDSNSLDIDLNRTIYQFDEATLLQQKTDSIALQLSAMQNLDVLNTFVASNELQSKVWIYETKRYGGSWYVVLSKQLFETPAQALSAVNNLPDRVKDKQPFAKSLGQIQQEIRTLNNN